MPVRLTLAGGRNTVRDTHGERLHRAALVEGAGQGGCWPRATRGPLCGRSLKAAGSKRCSTRLQYSEAASRAVSQKESAILCQPTQSMRRFSCTGRCHGKGRNGRLRARPGSPLCLPFDLLPAHSHYSTPTHPQHTHSLYHGRSVRGQADTHAASCLVQLLLMMDATEALPPTNLSADSRGAGAEVACAARLQSMWLCE